MLSYITLVSLYSLENPHSVVLTLSDNNSSLKDDPFCHTYRIEFQKVCMCSVELRQYLVTTERNTNKL